MLSSHCQARGLHGELRRLLSFLLAWVRCLVFLQELEPRPPSRHEQGEGRCHRKYFGRTPPTADLLSEPKVNRVLYLPHPCTSRRAILLRHCDDRLHSDSSAVRPEHTYPSITTRQRTGAGSAPRPQPQPNRIQKPHGTGPIYIYILCRCPELGLQSTRQRSINPI